MIFKDRRGHLQLKEEALCGGIVLEEALDLSFDRLQMMVIILFSVLWCYTPMIQWKQEIV